MDVASRRFGAPRAGPTAVDHAGMDAGVEDVLAAAVDRL
jgi:hypothetical protein